MENSLITLAIPAFFVLIALELAAAWRAGRRVYRLVDAVADLSCGISQRALLVLLQAPLFAAYVAVHERAAFRLDGAAAWLVGFAGVDFIYYWWHRASHEVNVLWAAHIVHHQSEDYNLAVALRQALFTSVTALPFYLLLALAGVPPLVFGTLYALSTLYQFWIHTELIGTLGPLEWVFNTPSHHRVHHAINPEYLDKNYGATLIVWDRLFGTFAREVRPPVYGITKPLRSFNPLWANVHYWIELGRLARAAATPTDKLRVWFQRPAWRPANLASTPLEDVERATFRKHAPPVSSRRRIAWVVTQLLLLLGAVTLLLHVDRQLGTGARVAAVGLILVTVATLTGLLEHRRWAPPLEAARLAGVAALLVGGL